jgi:tripartite-type tricarboxylate transporter receptor subunit TctC
MLAATTSRRAVVALGASLGIAPHRHAGAQPQAVFRPTRLIVPASAGSAPDVAARLLAEGLSRRRGHPVAVENRAGADGVLGAEAFAQARPGEALFFSFSGPATIAALMQARLPYDPEADLVPVHATVTDFLGLFVAPTLPVQSVAEFVEHVRARPGTLNWWGAPGGPELNFRNFLRQAGGLDMAFVAYRGSPPALLDLANGRIHATLSPLAPALPLAREGRIRLLAVTNRTRAKAAPEAPTVVEAEAPALEMEGLLGLYGWRGIPEATRAELAAQAQEALADPGVAERLLTAGMEPRGPGSPAAFAAELAGFRTRWAALAREFGIRPAG